MLILPFNKSMHSSAGNEILKYVAQYKRFAFEEKMMFCWFVRTIGRKNVDFHIPSTPLKDLLRV